MSFLNFAAELQVEVDGSLAALVERVLVACDHFNVTKRDECVRAFVALSNSARLLTVGQDDLTLKQLEQFREIRDLASKLRNKLRELREEEVDELTYRNLSPLDLRHDFSGAIEDAAQHAGGLRNKRDVVGYVARQFVLLCHEYRIALKWSKNLDSCSEYCSARLLGAIFEAGRLSFSGDGGGEQRTAADSANNCLSKLAKGFYWEFHYEHGQSEFAHVYLNRIVRESDIGPLPRFSP